MFIKELLTCRQAQVSAWACKLSLVFIGNPITSFCRSRSVVSTNTQNMPKQSAKTITRMKNRWMINTGYSAPCSDQGQVHDKPSTHWPLCCAWPTHPRTKLAPAVESRSFFKSRSRPSMKNSSKLSPNNRLLWFSKAEWSSNVDSTWSTFTKVLY